MALLLASGLPVRAQAGHQQAFECTTVRSGRVASAGQPALQPFVVSGSRCEQYPEYAPGPAAELYLPAVPIQTIRIMFHVFQKADGTGNWQAPQQDGGADEALLRGLVDGIAHYPTSTSPTSPTLRGLNGIYSQLDQRETAGMGHPTATPAQSIAADTRIRFQLVGIRYYRDPYFYDLSNNSPYNCGGGLECLDKAYERYVTNSTASQDLYKPNPVALPPSQKAPVMHIFFGESPGNPSTRPDQFGNETSRYGAGGSALNVPGVAVRCRGLYWTIKHHPYYAAGGVRNTDPLPVFGVKYAEYILAHEIGHCLGLDHTDGDACVQAPFTDPPARLYPWETNNIMDGPFQPGFSLSQCQIGKMHYYLTHAGQAISWAGAPAPNYLDNLVVEDYCQHDPGEDITIPAGQHPVWNSAHNLRGNLYIERDASLTVRCRVGFVGPEAKIVVREGGELLLDNGTLGNYAVSDVRECGDQLRLWLGGDGSDGDNGGLIRIRNGGGFSSPNLDAVLMTGATLHVEPVPVALDACRLSTLAGSYLCVEPGATFAYTRQAQFSIDPGTIPGLNPAIHSPANCQQTLCDVLSQTVAFSASTVRPGTTTAGKICPGTTVSMAVAAGNAGSGYTVTWYRNGTAVSGSAGYSDAPTGTAPVVYSAAVDFNNGCPPVTWAFTQLLSPAPGLTLRANTVTLCADGAGPGYNSGLFDLNSILTTLRDPNAPANQNTDYIWQEPVGPGAPVLDGVQVSPSLTEWSLDVPVLRNRGVSTYQLQLCNTLIGGGRCPTCATVTFTLQPGPAFTVPVSALACSGKGLTLSASGPSGTAYTWTAPGQPTRMGPSVTVSLSQPTTFTVTGEAGGCRTTRQVAVDVRPATCLACLPSPPIDVNGGGSTRFAAYTFAAGGVYRFTKDTELTTSAFVVPEGATLLFEPDVVLTLRDGARLDLRGGRLTGTCDEMWGGIVADASSGGVVSRQPATVPYSEISHSLKGLMVLSAAPAAPPALTLAYVAFLHNGQGVQVMNQDPTGPSFAGLIENCLFDSDPRLMRKPWQYQSAQDQHVSRHHLALTGDCANLVLRNSTLDRALVAIWVPTAAPFVAKHNVIRNFYVAGVYAHDDLPAATVLVDNEFEYPPVVNDVLTGRGAQMRELYNDIRSYEGPTAWLREGVCVGIHGSTVTTAAGPNFTLEGNHFTQPVALREYSDQVPFPQYGVLIDGGVVQHNTFQSLQLGYLSRSTQQAGVVRDNLFRDCVYGVFFTNGQQHATPGAGDALVSCNTFERLSKPGTSVGIMRDFCQQQALSDPCDQINFSKVSNGLGQQSNILQKNYFIGTVNGAYDRFYHVFNSDTNAPISYSTFDNIALSIAGNGNQVIVSQAGLVATSTANQTPSNPANDCASEGFSYGVQGLSTPNTPNSSAPVKDKVAAFLAQNVPNPCSGSTSISYRTPLGAGEAQLVVRTYFSGAVILRQPVPAGEHTVDLKVETLPPGSYHYALEVGGRPVAHHNLLVQ